jgi:hypothetical protein
MNIFKISIKIYRKNMLYKISEFEVEKLSISNSKDATYLQVDKQPFEVQTDWITLGQYPLPAKKFITDDAKSVTLTIPTNKGDDNYMVLSAIDSNLSKLKILPSKKYHPLVSEKEFEYYLKFKLYLNTGLFDKDKNRISITSLLDFYKYLKQGSTVKIVFGFSKLWSMGKEYGFSMGVRRILLKDEVKEAPEQAITFLDDSDE